MTSISQTNRYIPHELNTKFHAVTLFKASYSFSFVCRRYKISKSSLVCWSKRFDGTKELLMDKSHSSLSKHPNAHNDEELSWTKNHLRRNPTIFLCKLY